MIAYEGKPYHCADCGCVLRYERAETQFGMHRLLFHEPMFGCKFASKYFYIPKVDLNPCDIVENDRLNGSGEPESTATPPEPEHQKERTS